MKINTDDLRQTFIELIGYGWVSALALLVDTTVLYALFQVVGWRIVPASIVSFITGAGVAYPLSTRFVFRFRQISNHFLEFFYFLTLGVVGLLVNAVVLSVAVNIVGLGLIAAKLLAAGCTFTTNFTLRRILLFSRRVSRRDEIPRSDTP